ncbi:MAG: TetR/AcrR family transcriptional regulator, partial [Thermoleophilia bacterium]|nr:TetR/AcrR family transcriptional regulator [Beijerinckiaceae bacterium]MBY0361895.1 TetR/AcrR family transcriptional regulator [Phreatobacter sp.]MBY0398068.1 TetR/AcrR family transcriptional regulator [Thermoleophilia bacterium]
GYANLSLERVAKRAGVGKAALYRRWPSKAAMTSDALSGVGVAIADVPDTGSLLGDVRAALLGVRRALRHPLVRRILLDLHAEVGRSPDLEAAIRPFQAARRKRAQALTNRAVARGELARDVDHEIASDLLGAAIYWRIAVVGETADLPYVERLAIMLCAALTASGAGPHTTP